MRVPRPSAGRPLAIACLALFVSLGGVGYAAATGSIDSREIRNNSIRSKDVRNNGLSGRDIANASLSGADVKNGRLLGVDIEDESLTGKDLDERTLGPVPAAQAAAFAASAGNLGGVRVVPFGFRSDSTEAQSVRTSVAGLEVRAGCSGGDVDLLLVNRSGSPALLTYENANEELAPNESVNVGDTPADDTAHSGQAGFVVERSGRAVRVQWSVAEDVFGIRLLPERPRRRLAGVVFVYLLRCADDSLYCGWTDDVERAPRRAPRGQGEPLHAQPPAGGAGGSVRGGRPLGGAARGSADQAPPPSAKLALLA